MIILNRIAELIIKFRNSSISTDELKELYQWVAQRFEHFELFREMTNDEYLHKACAIIMEGDKRANWKKIEQKIFRTLSDVPKC
jgi:hypothetical protein